MTIKMIKTYAGPMGLFVGGMNLDLPEMTAKKLVTDGYAQSYAPSRPVGTPRLNKGKRNRK